MTPIKIPGLKWSDLFPSRKTAFSFYCRNCGKSICANDKRAVKEHRACEESH